MKRTSIIIFICLCYTFSSAQTIVKDTTKNLELTKTNFFLPDSVINRRNELNQTNATILLAWSAANIIQGSISAGNINGSKHYFHKMNSYFNMANLAFAGYGLYRLHQQRKMHYSLANNVKEQHKISSFLMLNTGLDVAYITTGLYLQEKGNHTNDDQSKGYGGSLILQGAFLLVFDIIQYVQHQQNGKLLNQYLGNLQLTTTSTGVGLVVPL